MNQPKVLMLNRGATCFVQIATGMTIRNGMIEIQLESNGFPPLTGVEVVAVNIAESKFSVQAFVDRYKLTFPILLDEERQVTEAYNIGPIPTTFVIDKNGVVVEKIVGSMPNVAYVGEIMKQVEPK
jgi:peroxiredoxin